MFRTLMYPSSGACDCAVELPHRSFCSWFVVCWRFGVAGFWVVPATRTPLKPSRTKSPTQRAKNKTTNVVIQQHSRKLLMMDILMSETCWVRKKWNKIASDIKLVFYSSTITMMHGQINISYHNNWYCSTMFIFSKPELARGPPIMNEILLMHLHFLSAFANCEKGLFIS